MGRLGQRANVESVERALDHHVREGNLSSYVRRDTAWHMVTSDGQEYTAHGLAQAHGVVVGLTSSHKAAQKKEQS